MQCSAVQCSITVQYSAVRCSRGLALQVQLVVCRGASAPCICAFTSQARTLVGESLPPSPVELVGVPVELVGAVVGSDLNFYKCAYLEVATPLHSYAKLPPYYTAVLRLYSTATLLHSAHCCVSLDGNAGGWRV